MGMHPPIMAPPSASTLDAERHGSGFACRRFSPRPPCSLRAMRKPCPCPPHILFRERTLAAASTPDPSGLRFARVRSVPPSSERVTSRGTAPLCPRSLPWGPASPRGQSRLSWCNSSFQILEGYHVSLRSPAALAVVRPQSSNFS